MISKTRKRRALLAAALVVGASGAFAASQAGASVAPSDFGGGDGNLVPGDANGVRDWNSPALPSFQFKNDLPTGQTDNSFAEGSKENSTNISVGLGSIPNSKADLARMYTSYEQIGNDVMLYLGWARNNTSGTTNFDFEVNRVTQPNMDTAGDKTLIRTAGDLLISYDFQGGSQKPTLAIREWTGSAWGAANPLDATEAESEVNRQPIVDALGVPTVNRAAFTFGEASINLTKAGVFVPGQCESFGSIFVKSRSSDPITATLKDFISPEAVNITNCASGIIRKETDPNGAAGSFGFTQNLDASGGFSLSDGGSKAFGGVPFGTYTVTENSLPLGWTLNNIDCSASTAGVATAAGSTVTILLDSASDRFDCTYNNQARGRIIVTKTTDPTPDPDATQFSFTPSWGAAFTLADGEQEGPVELAPGAYSVAETVPGGWDQLSVVCSSSLGDTEVESALELDAGETITCAFANQADANIVVTKVTEPVGDPAVFDFTSNYDADGFSLSDGQSNDSGDIDPGSYNVAETPAAGWNTTSDCVSSNDDAETAASISLQAGETVSCTFTNTRQRGAIEVTKTRKHAADGPGDHPQEGVTFDIGGTTVVTDADGRACVDGFLFGSYDVTETVPTGYVADGDTTKAVTVDNEASCDGVPYAGETVAFGNMPLSNVTVSVASQVPGGTSSTITCDDGSSVPADENPVLNITNATPKTLVCTIVIDP